MTLELRPEYLRVLGCDGFARYCERVFIPAEVFLVREKRSKVVTRHIVRPFNEDGLF